MDLLFKRYATPFILIDNLILTNSLDGFIDDLIKFIREDVEEKSQWEYFLHKVFDQSWKEFYEMVNKPKNEEKIDLGATLLKSKNILNNFTPDSEV